MLRISKHLSELGIASRRDAEKMIADGRVSVNGKKISTPVTFISDGDEICIDGKSIPSDERRSGLRRNDKMNHEPRVYLFHKPTGCLCTTRDPLGRKTIYDILPAKYRNLKYVGRLDYNTSGLLLMTDSGQLAREMTLPSAGIDRVYIAKIGRAWTIDDEHFGRLIKPVQKGIKIDGIIYRPMKIERLNASDLRITISEGKKNEIRIVFEHIGLPIRKLHRISYGPYELGTLRPGEIKNFRAP